MRRLFVLLLFALLLAAPAANAQQPGPSDDEVNAVAKKLYCPICENTPLDVCPTAACAQWRATIREQLAAGWSEQQILDYFVAHHGERVLARPSARGLNLLVWVLPPLAVLAGVVYYARYVRRLVTPGAPATPPAAPVDEYAARLEQELAERR